MTDGSNSLPLPPHFTVSDELAFNYPASRLSFLAYALILASFQSVALYQHA